MAGTTKDPYGEWVKQVKSKNVATYLETMEIEYGGQTVHVLISMENYNRRTAINTMAFYAFDYNDGKNHSMNCYMIIEMVKPSLSDEEYRKRVDGIRQQLIDFVGTVLVEK